MRRAIVLAGAVVAAPLAAQASPGGDYPVIVVGSGYGGSIAAYNLAQKKVPTLVLERGDWWSVDDPTADEPFPTAAEVLNQDLSTSTPGGGDSRVAWLRVICGGNLYSTLLPAELCQPRTGLIELVTASKDPYQGGSFSDFSPDLTAHGIAVLAAAGVGGGSLINNGVTFIPTKAAWDVAYPPAELPYMQSVYSDLVNGGFFQRALQKLDPAKPPADVLATPYYAGTKALYDFFGALGYPELDPNDPLAEQTSHRTHAPVIIDWDAVRDEIAGYRVPSVINGEAWWGINSGAKKSLDTDKGYLGKALKSGLVEVRALHTVSDISYDAATKLYTVTAVHTDTSYTPVETVHLTTPNLIMSAGSLGTTKLLIRARENGSLPNLNQHVGTRFSSNGNTGGLAILRSPAQVDELGPLPQGGPAGVKVYDLADPQNPVVFENLPTPQPHVLASVPSLSVFRGATSVIAVGVPTKTGEFVYDAASDSVSLNWPEDGALNVLDRFEEVYSNLGAAFVSTGQTFTLHPLGGVPLGLATDMHCQLQGYQGLYAVDGSIIPGSAAATNPSGLISSMAERCMKQIASDIAARLK